MQDNERSNKVKGDYLSVMNPWTEAIVDSLEPLRNARRAEEMEAYLKNLFPLLGISSPARREAVARYFHKSALPDPKDLSAIARELYKLDAREYHYVATDLLKKMKKSLTTEDLSWVESLITSNSWWDTVDAIAAHPVGQILQQDPEGAWPILQTWIRSDNMWLNRAVIICQLMAKDDTNTKWLEEAIAPHAQSKEFFHRKAIGWALRQYRKTNPDWVLNYVDSHPELSGLSRREALK